MVKLINIEKTNEFITCEYSPEASGEKGYIKMDLQGNVVEKKLTSYDGYISMYFGHARRRLKEILKEGHVPKESLVMWY